MRKIVFFIISIFVAIFQSSSQTYNMPGGTINTCSGNFYDTGGSGGNYSNNQNITTTFCSNAGNCIQVSFSSFNIENNYDFLSIYDGPNTSSPLIGTYTGNTSPGTITSSSGCLTFVFTSDGSVTQAGWAASISCVSCPPPSSNYNMPGGTINTCSGNFYDTGGSGGNYSNNQNITTTFCSNAGNCIQFSFSSFNIENNYDFLYIYDGPNTSSPLIGTYTGTNSPGTITSSGGCLTFVFTSDGSVTYQGWAASITCTNSCSSGPSYTPQDCAGAITVCSDGTYNGNSSGYGSSQELNAGNDGCLYVEHQSSWYFFQAQTSGTFQLTISPTNGTDDYDFALWGPFPSNSTPTSICPPSSPPIRCSYAAGGGNTGMVNGAGDNTEGAGGDRWVNSLNMNAGDVYILLIDNYSATTSPFVMDITLTNGATFNCNPLPIKLLTFDVILLSDNTAEILWETENENNIAYYILEKTTDFNFISQISIVKPKFDLINKYSVQDRIQELSHEKNVYYRLVEMDVNGKRIEYPWKSINLNLFKDNFYIYPNPFEDILTIRFNQKSSLNISKIELYDITGKKITEIHLENNHSPEIQIDLSLLKLKEGIYTIQLKNQERLVFAKKIIRAF